MNTPNSSQCPSNDISRDSMDLIGTILSGIAYGVVFTICTLRLCTRSSAYGPKLSWRTPLTCWLFFLATISIALQIRWTQLAFVIQRQVSPSAFIKENTHNWIYVMLNVLYVSINWSADGILVFWFFKLFGQSLWWWILPAALYLSSLVTGSLALRELATPGTIQDTNKLVNWLIVYRTLSLSLCVILTSFITGRIIIIHRRRASRFGMPTSRYIIVVRKLVESASLETVSTLVYVITVGLGSPLQNVFLPILGQVQVIAPMLTLYRVVQDPDTTAGLPKHHDKTVTPPLCIQIGTNMSFCSLACDCSASPTKSSRGLDCPGCCLLPPYAPSSFNGSSLGNFPQSPAVDPAHMSDIQKLGVKRPATWP